MTSEQWKVAKTQRNALLCTVHFMWSVVTFPPPSSVWSYCRTCSSYYEWLDKWQSNCLTVLGIINILRKQKNRFWTSTHPLSGTVRFPSPPQALRKIFVDYPPPLPGKTERTTKRYTMSTMRLYIYSVAWIQGNYPRSSRAIVLRIFSVHLKSYVRLAGTTPPPLVRLA